MLAPDKQLLLEKMCLRAERLALVNHLQNAVLSYVCKRRGIPLSADMQYQIEKVSFLDANKRKKHGLTQYRQNELKKIDLAITKAETDQQTALQLGEWLYNYLNTIKYKGWKIGPFWLMQSDMAKNLRDAIRNFDLNLYLIVNGTSNKDMRAVYEINYQSHTYWKVLYASSLWTEITDPETGSESSEDVSGAEVQPEVQSAAARIRRMCASGLQLNQSDSAFPEPLELFEMEGISEETNLLARKNV